MPANLTQQYLKAEETYRRAATPEEQLQCLQEMLREAALAETVLQDEDVTQARVTALESVEQEPEAELVSPADRQKSRQQLELYLLFADPNDRDLVEGLSNILNEEGYNVAAIQFVDKAITSGDIRYRHEGQEKEVENIKLISENYLNETSANDSISLEIIDISDRYPNLATNRIELWLPQL